MLAVVFPLRTAVTQDHTRRNGRASLRHGNCHRRKKLL